MKSDASNNRSLKVILQVLYGCQKMLSMVYFSKLIDSESPTAEKLFSSMLSLDETIISLERQIGEKGELGCESKI